VNVIPLDPEGHARVQALLPWFVTGRLEESERTQVETHLAGCARCRAELALERQLHAAHAAEPETEEALDSDAAERGLARLRRRIDRSAARAPSPPARSPRLAWWRWTIGVQFAAIAGLAVALVVLIQRPDGAPYRGLGAPSSNSANAVVMFSPDATEAQMRQALRAADAHLVGGPTTTQAYLLALPIADAEALARLRAQPGVTMAESLAAEGGS